MGKRRVDTRTVPFERVSDQPEGEGEPTRVYITQSYESPYATINPLWAAAREYDYRPDRVHLITPEDHAHGVDDLVGALESLQSSLDREPDVRIHSDDPESFEDTAATIREIIRTSHDEGAEVAVDITPGRTIPKIALFDACLRLEPAHIFYLSVPGYDYRPKPYVKIPFRLQNLLDLTEEVDRPDV